IKDQTRKTFVFEISKVIVVVKINAAYMNGGFQLFIHLKCRIDLNSSNRIMTIDRIPGKGLSLEVKLKNKKKDQKNCRRKKVSVRHSEKLNKTTLNEYERI